MPDPLFLAALLFALLALPLARRLYAGYREEARLRALEGELPYALLHVAAFPASASFESRVASVAESGFPALEREFRLFKASLQNGFSFLEALQGLRRRNPSPLFHRALFLLEIAYRSGEDARLAVRQVADDALRLQRLALAHASLLALSRYSLLLAAALLVPFVLGSVLRTAASLATGTSDLLPSVALGMQIYLALFSLQACAFAGLQEGNLKKGLAYFCFVLPSALAVFRAAGGATGATP